MSRQLEQALLSLIPTWGSDLPPQLVDLSASLLAQSRNAASTLKADEEIARLYACANIACNRLKTSLDLPPVEPRPPIPPRIYKRLYAHLDNVLPNHSTPSRKATRARTPSSRLRNVGAVQVSPSKGRATPTKEESLAQQRGGSKPNPGRFSGPPAAPSDNLYSWIRPVTRFLVSELGQKNLGPTIIAGMDHLMRPGGRRAKDEWVLENATALLAAIYYFVDVQAQSLGDGAHVGRQQFTAHRKDIISTLNRAHKVVTVRGVPEADAWEGWSTVKSKDFDEAVEMINDRDWLSADWYRGITDVLKSGGQLGVQNSDEEEEEEEDEAALPSQTQRSDTMLQPRYNLLSEEKRAEYKSWKENILVRIEELSNARTAMDVEED